MNKLSIRDLDMRGKRVFIRVDFNVPLENGKVAEDTRIRETLPTLRYAIERGARLILASHLGRPKGKRDPKYTLKPVAARLSELIGGNVDFASDCIGPEAESKSRGLREGTFCFSKMSATIRKKKPTTKISRNSSPRSAISFSYVMLSDRRTARTPPLWASRNL